MLLYKQRYINEIQQLKIDCLQQSFLNHSIMNSFLFHFGYSQVKPLSESDEWRQLTDLWFGMIVSWFANVKEEYLWVCGVCKDYVYPSNHGVGVYRCIACHHFFHYKCYDSSWHLPHIEEQKFTGHSGLCVPCLTKCLF